MEHYVPQSPKWTRTSAQPVIGDIVIFLRTENEAGFWESTWSVGRVLEIEVSADGVTRSALIQYKNATEKVFRSTKRSVRKMVILCSENMLELVDQLNEASHESDVLYAREQNHK